MEIDHRFGEITVALSESDPVLWEECQEAFRRVEAHGFALPKGVEIHGYRRGHQVTLRWRCHYRGSAYSNAMTANTDPRVSLAGSAHVLANATLLGQDCLLTRIILASGCKPTFEHIMAQFRMASLSVSQADEIGKAAYRRAGRRTIRDRFRAGIAAAFA